VGELTIEYAPQVSVIPWGIAWPPREWGYSSGPAVIRTRDFFSAIDKQVGEKGEKGVYYV